MNPYESNTLLDQYLLFHYGDAQDVAPPATADPDTIGFPCRTISLAPTEAREGSALDLGCAVGRSTFELSRTCASVTGLDYSAAFITAANQIREHGYHDYFRHEEGRFSHPLVARRPDGTRPEKVHFAIADATALPEDIGRFDLVHAANLICRLPDPEALLSRLPSLVSPGGYLVLTTPCTWLGEFTPPAKWPDKPTLDWLCDRLGAQFDLERVQDIPFLIRETARKFQWSIAQGSLWRLR